ncbi:MAG: Lpg1974 family pore-forming outer membrane protein [Verrucomicrobiota bacterium JB025]|nr:Lpg1974 family pore-forming outer membrane protein [Verrucomicrobiota bacterium JB025]
MLPMLLCASPLFAGETAPMMAPAPSPVCDCPQGFTLGLEILALKPYQSEGEYGDDGDYDAGFRGSIGYEFGDCLFIKATGFGYSTDLDDDDSSYDIDLDMGYVDLVVGQHFNQCDSLTLSPFVGLRWAMLDEGWDDGYYTYDSSFDGIGIVLGIDATRTLGSNLSLYATAKQSIVFGTTDYEWGYKGDNYKDDDYSSDNVVFISELGLGLQYDFMFSNVAGNVRLGAEGQWWSGASDEDSEDTGLAGFVLGANFRF